MRLILCTATSSNTIASSSWPWSPSVFARLFIAENVDGMSQNFAGAYLKRIAADFASLGYAVSHYSVQGRGVVTPPILRAVGS